MDSNTFSVSNFNNALLLLRVMKKSVYLDKYPIVYFHGRVLWRLADLGSTPYLASLAARETTPVRI